MAIRTPGSPSARILPLLSADLRVIAPDMRGHGDSERPSAGYRIADMADDVLRLMDALDVPKAVLIGHSMGSFVARKVFELAPARVTAGVGWRGDQGRQPRGSRVAARHQRADQSGGRGVRARFSDEHDRHAGARIVPRGGNRQQPAHARAHLESRAPGAARVRADGGAAGRSRAGARRTRGYGVLPHRADGARAPVSARRAPARVDGVGHALHWEQPAMFVRALARFGV